MKPHHKNTVICVFIAVCALSLAPQVVAEPPANPTSDSTRLNWWRDAKFGMFIHWGIYAVAEGQWDGKPIPGAGEWIMHNAHIPVNEYSTLANQFNPAKFNAAQWVAIAKDAGMKYIVITSKHHDGFCMFDSALTNYDVVDATPFRRDVIGELAEECQRQGMKLGLYYSIMDWHHPEAKGAAFPKYVEYVRGQVRELLTNYGSIAVMWFDGEWIDEWTPQLGDELYQYCRKLQPNIIVNNRVGKGRAGTSASRSSAGDFGTPEQEIPDGGIPGYDWETCMTMNDTWGFRRDDRNWKSADDLIKKLVEIANKGGNFLLNVGPTAQGEIPAASTDRLAQIGAWLRVNGESIYAVQASPFEHPSWGRLTARPGQLFLHVFDWPKDRHLTMSPFTQIAVRVAFMENLNSPLHYVQENDELRIDLQGPPPESPVSVIVVQVADQPKAAVAQSTAATSNQLTRAERAAGWKMLFDGQSISKWRGYRTSSFPANRWSIDDGCLKSAGGGEEHAVDLVTNDQYGDFELVLEWKTAPGGNSGIMYRVAEKEDHTWQTGPEYQILDDAGAHVKSNDLQSAGALYELYPPVEAKVLNPAGQFNLTRIRLQDHHLEHWLNGVKIVECDVNSDDFKSRVAKSKFNEYEGFAAQSKGHIALQDHGDVVWFRNIKVRDLDAPMSGEILLFDGKSMKGWTHHLEPDGKMEDTWRIEDGILICKGQPNGYIRTETDYTNYVLKLQWRFNPITKQAGNSGVLLRMVGPDKVWPKSIEAQLHSQNAGDFWNIDEFQMKTDPARTNGRNTKKLRMAERPIGEWNEYEIIVDGGDITLNVNGDTLNRAWDVAEVPGKICLQSEGAEIQFRNIRLAPIQ